MNSIWDAAIRVNVKPNELALFTCSVHTRASTCKDRGSSSLAPNVNSAIKTYARACVLLLFLNR